MFSIIVVLRGYFQICRNYTIVHFISLWVFTLTLTLNVVFISILLFF